MLAALIEGLHQPFAVDEVERRGSGVLLGGVGEAAHGDEKSALCIGRDNRVMEGGKLARGGRLQIGRRGASGDEFFLALGRH